MKERVKKFQGVYVYTSEKRRYQGRPDQCFYIRIKNQPWTEWTKVGWRSEGVDAAYAFARRQDIMTSLREGKNPTVHPVGSMTLREAYDLWMKNHAKINTKRPEAPQYHWKSMIEPHLSNHSLESITALDLESLKGLLQKQGLAPQSIKHALSLIRRIYKKMIAWDLYAGNIPTAKVDMPKVSNSRERWLTVSEANMLLDELCCRSTQIHHMAMFSLHTGMRFGEVAALTGEKINLTSMTIRLTDTKSSTDRTVYITETIHQILQTLNLQPGIPLFPSRQGGCMNSVSDAFTRAVKELGLNEGITDRRNKVVFHTLRHTFGSWLAMSGTPLYWIGKLMGHAKQETTARYAHLCPDMQRQATSNVDRMFQFKSINPAAHLSAPVFFGNIVSAPEESSSSSPRS